MESKNVKFNGVHHRFTFSNDRVSDLKSKSELNGFKFFVREDLLTRVHNAKKLLNPFIKEARSEDEMMKTVYIDRTFVDDDNGAFIEIR